jgi:hypothetical protein
MAPIVPVPTHPPSPLTHPYSHTETIYPITSINPPTNQQCYDGELLRRPLLCQCVFSPLPPFSRLSRLLLRLTLTLLLTLLLRLVVVPVPVPVLAVAVAPLRSPLSHRKRDRCCLSFPHSRRLGSGSIIIKGSTHLPRHNGAAVTVTVPAATPAREPVMIMALHGYAAAMVIRV